MRGDPNAFKTSSFEKKLFQRFLPRAPRVRAQPRCQALAWLVSMFTAGTVCVGPVELQRTAGSRRAKRDYRIPRAIIQKPPRVHGYASFFPEQ